MQISKTKFEGIHPFQKIRNQVKVLWISENDRQRRTALVKMNYYRHPPSLPDRNEVWLESIQPFNIKKLDNGTLVPFNLLPLGPHKLIPVFLPLFRTICKVLFWDRHQLPRCIRLNLLPFNSYFSFGKSQKSYTCHYST